MKKFLISILAISLVAASLMTGCSDTDNRDVQNPGGNEDAANITVPEVILAENDSIVVMNVGGKDISKALLRYCLSNFKLSNPEMSDEELSNTAIDVIKQYVAIDLMAEMADVEFTDAVEDYYNQAIALSIQQTNAQEGNSYEKALEELFMTDSVYRYATKNSLLTEVLFTEYATEGGKKYTPVTDSEILDIAKKDYVRVKHVLIKTDEIQDREELDKAKALAEDIRDRATNGENFEELVKTFSADSMDVEKGYYFTTGRMVPEFETASFMISVGNVAMVESTYGYHIIKKYEMLDEHILGDATLRSEIESAVYSKKFVDEIKATQEALECTINDNYQSAVAEILAAVPASDAQ